MPTPSIAEILQCVAKVETTYGTDAAPVGGTDDALLIDSPTPVNTDGSFIEARDHTGEFTWRKGVFGKRKNEFTVEFRVQGSGALGATANGFAGQDALVQCCGVTSTKNAGTSIVWTPSTRAALKSSTVWFAEDGVRTKIPGCYGSLSLSGDPNGFVRARVEGAGLYAVEELGANGTISGYVGGTARAEAFLNAAGTINNGASMTAFVFDSFNFTTGSGRDDVDDANSTTGLHRILFTARKPNLSLVVMLDSDSAATIPFSTLKNNMFAHTTHNVTFSWGTTPNKCTANFPQAQLMKITKGVKNNYRIATLEYLVQHSTNNSEFAFTFN